MNQNGSRDKTTLFQDIRYIGSQTNTGRAKRNRIGLDVKIYFYDLVTNSTDSAEQ